MVENEKMKMDSIVGVCVSDDEIDDDEQVLYFPRKRKNKRKFSISDDDDDEFQGHVVVVNGKDEEDPAEFDLWWRKLAYPSDNDNDNDNDYDYDYDYDDEDKDEGGIVKETEEERKKRVYEKFEAWYQEQEKNVPPLFNNDVGELDFSDAVFIEVDGLELIKKEDYNNITAFIHDCRQKCNLELFTHPGDPRVGGLGSIEGKNIRDEERELAVLALKKYQEVKGDEKLKLGELIKLNYAFWGGEHNFITFSAENEKTGEVKIYQAALAELNDGYVLGLLRNVTDSKVLAVPSVTGVKEHLGAKENLN